MMAGDDCADRALDDTDLMQRVVEHKTLFYRRSWSRYDLAVMGSFKLRPRGGSMRELEDDYRQMMPMIYGDNVPVFEEIIDRLQLLENRINKINDDSGQTHQQ